MPGPWAQPFAPLEGRLVEIDALGQSGQCVAWREEEQEYVVRTFDGLIVNVPEEGLRELSPPSPREPQGFDVVWPEGEAAELSFPSEVLACLAQHGFCLVRTFIPEAAREEALQEARGRREEFEALRTELESSWLGEGDATRVLRLEAVPTGGSPSSTLEGCDAALTALSRMLAPLTPSTLGFTSVGRTSSFVRLPSGGLDSAPLTDDDVEDGKVEELIHFLRCRRLSMLHVIDCDEGEVELVPLEGTKLERTTISITANRLLLFRHDLFRYSFWPMGYSLALQAWVLCEPLAVDFTCLRGPPERRAEAMGLSGPPRPAVDGQPCYVASLLERMPGSVYGAEPAWAMFFSGGDTAVRWPHARWDESLYYSDNQAAALMGKTYSVHGAFMDFGEVSCFDHEFFGIGLEEAHWMAVEQRLVLEVGCETLVLGGYTREGLRGQKIGVFTGDVGSEELLMPPYSAFSQDGLQGGLCAARLSFCLDLRGPTASHDTACSSSLMALGFGHWKMQAQEDRPLTAALVIGVNLHMTPYRYIGLGSGGFLTRKGRCFTFDQSAEGYLRGEGCGGVLLRHGGEDQDRETRYAECIGTALNQDGRSASLTAPNGPSQQAVIRMSMRMARITADMVGAAECHGTGTSLGDPIELGALIGSLGDQRGDRPLAFTTSKINLGHTEAHAGMAGIAKCVMCCQRGATPPHNHLHALSPHLHLEGFPCFISTDPTDNGRTSDLVGVSSFGFGGSNGRADFWGRSTNGSTNLQDKMDYVEVSCPRCLGPMCWLCGVAVPAGAPAVRHRCSLLRGDGARYDYCSHCFRGQYKFGTMLEGMGNPGRRIFIVGTWSAWQTMHEMERPGEGTYIYNVVLGDTRWERFYLVVDRDRKLALYPAGNKSDPSARILGPDDKRGARNWLIDGRADGRHQGAVYRVTFHWSDTLEVSWAPVLAHRPEGLAAARPGHTYYLRGSWAAWHLQAMTPSPGDEGLHEAAFKIGAQCREEFQIVRDRDMLQVVHPAQARAMDASVPVRGPDGAGQGKHWLVQGEEFEEVRVRLWVVEGLVSLTLLSKSLGKRTFQGGSEREAYYVVGSFTAGEFRKMTPSAEDAGIHIFELSVDWDGFEDFQIAIDQDWGQLLYPAAAGAGSGQALLRGPGDGGGPRDNAAWRIVGEPGEHIEIVLDMSQQDRRHVVRWRRPGEALEPAPGAAALMAS